MKRKLGLFGFHSKERKKARQFFQDECVPTFPHSPHTAATPAFEITEQGERW